MDEFVNRRIWDRELGLSYFCTICGCYKPEAEFYKSKRTKWGVETKCKIHFTKAEPDEVKGENAHLKFSRLTEKDFLGARKILNSLGYETSGGTSIHQQFLDKYKLNKNLEK